MPASVSLGQCYPNPFNATAQVTFDLPRAMPVDLSLFDLLGRRVASLSEGWQPAGTRTAIIRGENLGSGLYFVRLRAGSYDAARKVILLK